ncbi:hypothetical protein [Streptomyces sp. NPDC055036]
MSTGLRGGFKADREFGFQLQELFPHLDLSKVDTEGAALVVQIDNPRRLNLFQLSKVLIGAANGGVKTAVVVNEELATALPLFDLWMMVDGGRELKDMMRLESTIRTGV